jgi:hypothetical protein
LVLWGQKCEDKPPNKSNLILSEGKVILILSRGAVLARY